MVMYWASRTDYLHYCSDLWVKIRTFSCMVKCIKVVKIFCLLVIVYGPYSLRLTVRKEASGRCKSGSVTDRKLLDIRSVSIGYGPQKVSFTVRKDVAGQKIWTAVS
ncbi:hypothetical protein Hdeb2414_s0033g00723971 [Helianthus debilis subsp. tardiflorus]